ncbi:MAG: hypothetical protein J6W69_03850 [Bacteroidales bacterium]|nr:hypothetical protein [Bacteroidales bacterium]
MKKTLFLAVMATAASLSIAADKTVTFDFSDPTKYGYEKAEGGNGTPIAYQGTIVSDGVTIQNAFEGSSATTFRFFTAAADGTVTLRLATNGVFTVNAGGANITKIALTGSKLTTTNLSITPGTFEELTWTGSAETVTFTRLKETLQFSTMAVTFESDDNGGTPVSGKVTEVYESNPNNTFAEAFANAPEALDGQSIVTFGTDNVEAVGVAGTTPVDVQETETGVFPGWAEWNTPTWGQGNANLAEVKPGLVTPYIYYVTGTGNPAVEINAVQITTDGNPTGKWKADYVYYEADGSKGLPVMGLYYKFTVKQSGTMKFTIWSNKGSRKTFVVDEETKKAIPYTVEGYINGQNETLTNVVMKDVTGADSIGETMNRKRFLTYEEIQEIHNSNKNFVSADTTFVDETKTGEERIAADNIASIKVTDLEPWIIGAGNQAFWGWLTVDVEAGKTYWLFQHSSQIGFGGYEFTFDGDPSGIEEIKTVANGASDIIYDLSGRRVNSIEAGKLYIKNGKKAIIR